MKPSFILVAAIAAASFVSSASAQTVNITGSTAFRSVIHSATLAALGPNATWGSIGTSASSGANAQIYKNAAGTVIVRTAWSGSATGIRDVAANNGAGNTINFIPTSFVTSTTGTANAVQNNPGVAHIAMSDVFQASTSFSGGTYAALANENVAVVPFVFVANEGSPITNMTKQVFGVNWANGSVALSFYTGNAADTARVYCTGRDGGSGTRITTLAETGYGINNPVVQWVGLFSGTQPNTTITSLRICPTSAISGVTPDPLNPGNGGFTSGSGVRDLISGTAASVQIRDENDTLLSTEACNLVGYLGTGDAATAVTNGAVQLTWEGASYSTANVYNGKYTFWGYQHLYSASLSPAEAAVKNSIVAQIPTNLGSAGLALSLMNVNRGADGAVVAEGQ